MKISNRRVQFLLILSLATFLSFFNACIVGGEASFDEDEYAVINFDGPISYSYTLENGTVRTYTVPTEDKLTLFNAKEIAGYDQAGSYLRVNDKNDYELKLFLGPDPELLHPTGEKVYPAEASKAFLEEAMIYNRNKKNEAKINIGMPVRSMGEGPIDVREPIVISGKMIGIDTYRKLYRCKDSVTGAFIEFTKIGGGCEPETVEFLGMKSFHYPRNTIVADLASGKNSGLISNTHQLEVILRNTTPSGLYPQLQPVPKSQLLKQIYPTR